MNIWGDTVHDKLVLESCCLSSHIFVGQYYCIFSAWKLPVSHSTKSLEIKPKVNHCKTAEKLIYLMTHLKTDSAYYKEEALLKFHRLKLAE